MDQDDIQQQRIYRLMAGLASSGVMPDGQWLSWFESSRDEKLRANLCELLLKMRARIDDKFISPAPHERLEEVRGLMQAEGIDALIVGHDDENLNEYVTPGGERLMWLTGFRGSAGVLLITEDEAFLFVDGRYTLQVGHQIDPHYIQSLPLSEAAIVGATQKASAGQPWRIGVDDRLVSVTQFRQWQKAFEKVGHTLCAVSENPVDRAWQDRPSPPISPVVNIVAEYTGKNSHDKLQQVLVILHENSVDSLLIQAPEDIIWLLNIRAEDIDTAPLCLSKILVHAEGSIDWFVSGDRLGMVEQLNISDQVYCHDEQHFERALEMLADAGARVWLDPARTAARYGRMLTDWGVDIVEATDPVLSLASRLNAQEIAGMERAHIQDGCAMVEFMASLKAQPMPIQEGEFAENLLEYRRKQPDFLQESFHAIVATRANGALCHYRPIEGQDERIRWGDIVLIDSGGHYRCGTTDITRVISYDQAEVPLTDEFKRYYTTVLQGLIAISTVRFPKTAQGGSLDAIARAPLWAMGVDYDHGTGHGVGCNSMVHYGTHRISKGSSATFDAGMVVSLEPGVYLPERFGIRLENLAVVVEDEKRGFYRFENLTWVPFQRRMITVSMLAEAELSWLNNYHAEVYRRLAPHLPTEAARWLAEATAELI